MSESQVVANLVSQNPPDVFLSPAGVPVEGDPAGTTLIEPNGIRHATLLRTCDIRQPGCELIDVAVRGFAENHEVGLAQRSEHVLDLLVSEQRRDPGLLRRLYGRIPHAVIGTRVELRDQTIGSAHIGCGARFLRAWRLIADRPVVNVDGGRNVGESREGDGLRDLVSVVGRVLLRDAGRRAYIGHQPQRTGRGPISRQQKIERVVFFTAIVLHRPGHREVEGRERRPRQLRAVPEAVQDSRDARERLRIIAGYRHEHASGCELLPVTVTNTRAAVLLLATSGMLLSGCCTTCTTSTWSTAKSIGDGAGPVDSA